MVASSGRTKNLLGCAGKTVPESAAAGWGVRSKRTRQRSRLGGGGGSAAMCSRGRRRGRRRHAGAAGLEARGGDLVFLGAYLELEGAQAALEDCVGVCKALPHTAHIIGLLRSKIS